MDGARSLPNGVRVSPKWFFRSIIESSGVVMPAVGGQRCGAAASRARAAAPRAASASSELQPPAARAAAMRSSTAALAVR